MPSTPSERLREARLAAGYDSAAAAARAFGWSVPTYSAHENGGRSFSAKRAQQYGRAFQVAPSWLIWGQGKGPNGSAAPAPLRPKDVEVIGAVEAGAWKEAWQWSPDDRYTVPVMPDARWPHAQVAALKVKGQSMNRLFPEGSFVVIATYADIGIAPAHGDVVVCIRRTRAGLVEATLKQLEITPEGDAWLWPRSTRPEFQSPVLLGSLDVRSGAPPLDQVLADAPDDVEEIAIYARVTGAYRQF